MHVIFASYGNDSCALIQWAIEAALSDVTVLYNDTGWAAPEWAERLESMESWVKTAGFTPARTQSIGLVQLAKDKKAWPRQGMQFCTQHLKQKPSLEWLDKYDPDKAAICLVGVRREESRNRSEFPEWTAASEMHVGRKVWAPLVTHSGEKRDRLLMRAGIEPLPHRSLECWPCVNSNAADIRTLTPERINEIERIEENMGFTGKGKLRTFFRPYRHQGATGIREVYRWANEANYNPNQDSLDFCDDGWCEI